MHFISIILANLVISSTFHFHMEPLCGQVFLFVGPNQSECISGRKKGECTKADLPGKWGRALVKAAMCAEWWQHLMPFVNWVSVGLVFPLRLIS